MQYHSTNKSKQEAIPQVTDYYNEPIDSDVCDSDKMVAILGYVTLLGWLIAILLHDKHKSNFTTFHLRQSLGLIITGGLLALIPLIGWLMNIAVFLVWLYVIYHATQGRQEKVPVLGDCYQDHLDFIK